MGRHPLSKTKDGKQIKNLDDKPRDDKGKDGKDGKDKDFRRCSKELEGWVSILYT